MADIVTLKTRLQLKYDSYANWTSTTLGADKGANFVLKAGEIGICYLPTNSSEAQVAGSQPPQILFKVGNGTAKFSELPWASAKAADVYEWAKQANLPVTKDGTGNVVSGIAWDEATKGIKFTTTSVATSSELEDLTRRVKTVEDTFVSEEELAAAVSAINTEVEKKANKSYVDSELAKYQPKGDYATKAEAQGYANAKDEAISNAQKDATDALNLIGDMSKFDQLVADEGITESAKVADVLNILKTYMENFFQSFPELFGDYEQLTEFINAINNDIDSEYEVNLVNGLAALRDFIEQKTAELIGTESLPEGETINGYLIKLGRLVETILSTNLPNLSQDISDVNTALNNYKTSNDKAVNNAQTTANQAKEAIDAFLASADASDKAIDTLKEIQSELDKGAGSAADMLAEINKIKDGTTTVPNATNATNANNATNATNAVNAQNAVNATNATNAQTAASASALDATGVEQVKGIKVNSATSADNATDAAKLGGTAASGYLLKTEAAGYNDILTKTLASTTYQPKGNYATAQQGALADSAVQPAALNSYYTKTEADAAFMDSTETGKAIDDKIAALNLSTTYEPIGAETRANNYADGLAKNYATAAQGALAASALQSIEAGIGLSVSNKNKINFDTETIFVFNCGSSTDII